MEGTQWVLPIDQQIYFRASSVLFVSYAQNVILTSGRQQDFELLGDLEPLKGNKLQKISSLTHVPTNKEISSSPLHVWLIDGAGPTPMSKVHTSPSVFWSREGEVASGAFDTGRSSFVLEHCLAYLNIVWLTWTLFGSLEHCLAHLNTAEGLLMWRRSLRRLLPKAK